MIGAIVGLVLGIGMLVIGLALLAQERSDRKAWETAHAAPADAAQSDEGHGEQEDTSAEGQESDATQEEQEVIGESGYKANFKRLKMGVQLVAQGVLLVVISLICFAVDALWLRLPWYAVVPAVVLFAIISFVMDAYTMGATIEQEENAANVQQIEGNVQDCTEKTQDNEDASANDDATDGV